MATGDRKINIHINRLLSKTDLREYFLDYLSRKVDETIASFFIGSQGTLDDEKIGLAADGADRFKLDMSDANRVGVQDGQFITIPDENDVSKFIKFENAAGVWYHVGMRYNEVPWNQVQINPKYGTPEYPTLMDSCGDLDAPTQIVNSSGVKIAIRLDSITEVGVDHSGRNVKCWLSVPVSGIVAQAFYEGVSYYSGGYNWVDIPYTGSDGPLGQDTASGPPSTTPGDYRVWIKGVSWRRNYDLSANADYWYAGRLQGVGAGGTPTVFDITSQALLFLITLDRAYDGPPPYPGFGRVINVDAGAVELITGAAGSGDTHNSQYRLSRKADTGDGAVMLELLTPDQDGGRRAIPIAVLTPCSTAGGEVQANESCTLAGSTITLTRGGSQDLKVDDAYITPDLCLVEVRDTDHDGLYFLNVVSNNSATVFDMRTGVAPSFSGGDVSGMATFHRVAFAVSLKPRTGGHELRGSRFVGIDGAGGDLAFKLFPCGNVEHMQIFDSAPTGPFIRTFTDQHGILNTNGLRITPNPQAAVDIDGGTTEAYEKLFLDIDASEKLGGLDNQSAILGRLRNQYGGIHEKREAIGRRARGNRFQDEFMYDPDWFQAVSGGPVDALRPYWRYGISGGGTTPGEIRATSDIGDVLTAYKGGKVMLKTPNLIAGFAEIKGPGKWWTRDFATTQRIHMYASWRNASGSHLTDMQVEVGLRDIGATHRVYWLWSDASGFAQFRLIGDDNGSIVVGDTGVAGGALGPQSTDDMHAYITIDPDLGGGNGKIVGTIAWDNGGPGQWKTRKTEATLPASDSFDGVGFQPFFKITTEAAENKIMYPAFVEVWDEEIRSSADYDLDNG